MPHIILEYTAAIQSEIESTGVLKDIHQAVIQSGLFSPQAVKTRMVGYPSILWGEEAESIDFVHVTVKILSGRNVEQRRTLSHKVYELLTAALPNVPKRSVDIHEMNADTYVKEPKQ